MNTRNNTHCKTPTKLPLCSSTVFHPSRYICQLRAAIYVVQNVFSARTVKRMLQQIVFELYFTVKWQKEMLSYWCGCVSFRVCDVSYRAIESNWMRVFAMLFRVLLLSIGTSVVIQCARIHRCRKIKCHLNLNIASQVSYWLIRDAYANTTPDCRWISQSNKWQHPTIYFTTIITNAKINRRNKTIPLIFFFLMIFVCFSQTILEIHKMKLRTKLPAHTKQQHTFKPCICATIGGGRIWILNSKTETNCFVRKINEKIESHYIYEQSYVRVCSSITHFDFFLYSSEQ